MNLGYTNLARVTLLVEDPTELANSLVRLGLQKHSHPDAYEVLVTGNGIRITLRAPSPIEPPTSGQVELTFVTFDRSTKHMEDRLGSAGIQFTPDAQGSLVTTFTQGNLTLIIRLVPSVLGTA